MDIGDYVYTPRFCTVQIKEIFETMENARANGYTEPTFYKGDYKVFGKSVGHNQMIFAAVKEGLYEK